MLGDPIKEVTSYVSQHTGPRPSKCIILTHFRVTSKPLEVCEIYKTRHSPIAALLRFSPEDFAGETGMDSLRWMSPEQPELSARGFCKCSQPWEGRSWEAQKGAGIHSITRNRGLPGDNLSVPWEILVLGKSHCFCRFWLLAFANLAGLASKVRTKTFRFCERINSKSSKVALAIRLVPLSRLGRFGSVGMVWDGHRNLQCYRLLCVSQRSCGLAVKFRAAWLPIACQSWYNMSFHELSLDFTRSLYDQEADAAAD